MVSEPYFITLHHDSSSAIAAAESAERHVHVNMQASNGVLRVSVGLPEGHHLTKGANSRFEIASEQPGAIAFEPSSGLLREQGGNAVAEVAFRRSDAASARLTTKVYHCLDGGACLFQETVFQMQFLSEYHGRQSLDLSTVIPADTKFELS